MKYETNFITSFAIEHEVFKVFEKPIVLKSGKSSHIYINWRTVSEDMYLMDQLSDHLAKVMSEYSVDTVIGVAEGATKLGLLTQYKLSKLSQNYSKGSHAFSMIRGRSKEHGSESDKYLIGRPKGRVALIEDVTTTGGSLLDAVRILKEFNGIEVDCIFVLTDRGDCLNQVIEDAYGIPSIALSKGSDLAEEYLERKKASEEFKAMVREEFNS